MRSLIWKPIAILLLGACTGAPSSVNEIVLNDVQQAGIMAERTNDKLASLCWDYLHEAVTTITPETEAPRGDVVGVLSAYQKARNVRRLVEMEVSDDFKLACGPMLLDSAGSLGRLGLRLR